MDWGTGAKWPYEQAAGNGFLVAAELSTLLTYLRDHGHVNLADIHIIGHSLGAQVAGLAGHSLTKIGRITGLCVECCHAVYVEFTRLVKIQNLQYDNGYQHSLRGQESGLQ